MKTKSTGKSATQQSATAKMVTGSAWMTAGTITSRLLGAVYVIPWVTWMGVYSDQANALYAKGYNIYSYLLILASAGIPSAISQMVGDYNGRGQYLTSRRLYRSALYFSLLTGIVFATFMYFGAPWLSQGDANLVPVLRSLAWAVLLIPAMSISRGYLQGYNWMAPSALSQFVEQLIRVIYMLAATFMIMEVSHGHWQAATMQSTFAAFVGAVGSCVVLIYVEWRQRKYLAALSAQSQNDPAISTVKLIRKIVYKSIPFIIIESAIVLFQLFDQFTFQPIMDRIGHFTTLQIDTLYALFAFNTNKIYMIIVSLATALAVTAIPLLANARARNNLTEIQQQIEKATLLFAFVMMPAALGLAAVAQPVYTVFYRYSEAGTTLMAFAAFMSIPYGLYNIGAAMMQGISENRRMMTYLGIGVVIKMILQYPAIKYFTAVGPLLATAVAMLVVLGLVYHHFSRAYGVQLGLMVSPLNKIISASLVMYVIVRALVALIYVWLNPAGRYLAFFALIPAVGIGALVFVILVLKNGVAEEVLGMRIQGLKRKLHL